MRRSIALTALALLVVGGLYTLAGSTAMVASISASSPRSVLPYGTSAFYSDLKAGWHVSTGGVSEALGADAYLVIAPDETFTPGEVKALRERLARGGFAILVADETEVGADLAQRLAGVRLYRGRAFNAEAPPGSPAIETVAVDCLGERIVTTRITIVEDYPRWMKPICWALDVYVPGRGRLGRAVLAVYGEINGSRVLVVADSTIFTNMLYNGAPAAPPTRRAALRLVEMVAPPGSTVVYDTSHLAASRLDWLVSAAILAVEAPQAAVSHLMGTHGAPAALGVAAGSAVAALVALGAPSRPGRPRFRAPRGAVMYLARECRALAARGAECPPWLALTESEILEEDLEWAAERILSALEGGGRRWRPALSPWSRRRSRR